MKTVHFRQAARNAAESALPRSVHVAEVVSEALVSELSAPASHRLDAVTEDHHSCFDVRNDSTLNVRTLLVDGQHFTIYFSALFVLVAFVHTLSRRSPRLPPSPSWHLTLSGLVLNVQSLGALQALFLIDFSSIISFFCVSLGLGAFCCVLQRYILDLSRV